MRNLILFAALLAAPLLGQTASYPTSVATNQQLAVGKDRSASTLSSGIDNVTLTVPVADGTQFVANEIITIDSEQMQIQTVVSNTLTVYARGFNGTTAASHSSGASVRGNITSWHHNALRVELQGIENVLTGSAPIRACTDAGSTDDYACNLSPAPTGYVDKVCYGFKANTANTGPATLNLNSLGAKTIKKAAGGITTDLADNDIRAGQFVNVCYDGTNMQMQSASGGAASPFTAPTNIKGQSTTLSAGITNVQTSITVTANFGSMPATPFYVYIGQEQLAVTSAAGTTWTVTRGDQGTPAAAHAAGSTVYEAVWAWQSWYSGMHATQYADSFRVYGSALGSGQDYVLGLKTKLAYSCPWEADLAVADFGTNPVNYTWIGYFLWNSGGTSANSLVIPARFEGSQPQANTEYQRQSTGSGFWTSSAVPNQTNYSSGHQKATGSPQTPDWARIVNDCSSIYSLSTNAYRPTESDWVQIAHAPSNSFLAATTHLGVFISPRSGDAGIQLLSLQQRTDHAVASAAYIGTTFAGNEQRLRIMFAGSDLTAFSNSLTSYASFVRDPSIARFSGKENVIYTTAAGGTSFGYTSSSNIDSCKTASDKPTCVAGATWSAEVLYDFAATIPGLTNIWAPEWVHNPDGSYWDSGGGLPCITFSGNTGAGTPPFGFAIYEVCATSLSPLTFGTPNLITMSSETVGASSGTLDTYMIAHAFGGTKFQLWYKHVGSTTSDQNLQWGDNTAISGAYTRESAGGDWAGWGQLQEGPAVLLLGSTWHMFEDAYENSLTLGQLYQSTSSDNWGQWDVQKAVQRLDTVAQAKHGTIIPVP